MKIYASCSCHTKFRQDAINFVNAYHEVRSYRDLLRLLLFLEHQMEFDQIRWDFISFGNDLVNNRIEETTQQYQLLAYLRATAARIRRIGEYAAPTANEQHVLQLIEAYEKNYTRHPSAVISIENLPELARIFNEVQIIVSTLKELLRFPRIINSTQHLIIDNANQIQHAEVHLLVCNARIRTIVAFGSNHLLQPNRSLDKNGFPQHNLRSIFSHLRYHAPWGFGHSPPKTNTIVRRETPIHHHIPFARRGFPILLL